MNSTDILLDKFQKIMDTITDEIIEESFRNFLLQSLISVTDESNELLFHEFKIQVNKTTINDRSKNQYNIIETSTGDILYRDLILFTSALRIVETLQQTKNHNKANHIAKLDKTYRLSIIDAYHNEQRKNNATSSIHKHVYAAKLSGAMSRAEQARHAITNISI